MASLSFYTDESGAEKNRFEVRTRYPIALRPESSVRDRRSVRQDQFKDQFIAAFIERLVVGKQV